MMWLPNSNAWLVWLVMGSLGMFLLAKPSNADDPTPNIHPQPSTDVSIETVLDRHLQKKHLTTFRAVQGDFDGDGLIDVAAHVGSPPDSTDEHEHISSLLVALASTELGDGTLGPKIVAEVPNGMLCPYCRIGSVQAEAAAPTQTLAVTDGQIEVCESWGTSWFARECDWLELAPARTGLRVERHLESSGWAQGPSEHTKEYDFARLLGKRSYSAHPLEPGYPIHQREVSFSIIEAPMTSQPPAVDGLLDDDSWQSILPQRFSEQEMLVHGKTTWKGRDDLEFSVRSLWSEDGLFLAIAVTDDSIIETDCSDRKGITRADRIELWLDLARGLSVDGNDASAEEYRRVYLEDPIRHEADEKLFNFAVGLTDGKACTYQFLPRVESSAEISDVLLVGTKRTDRGYDVEVLVPAEVFSEDGMETFEGRWMGTGFTIAVHDNDDEQMPRDRSSMATSSLTWGDPYTLGILIMPQSSRSLPSFPFGWVSWLR